MFNRVDEKIERNQMTSTSTLAERKQWRKPATSLDAVILGTCVGGARKCRRSTRMDGG
jgi:hypothetical protein